ncbi:uncharacterized protein B0I36DRAFT_254466, partial [Microdochium trichocladiopsis]
SMEQQDSIKPESGQHYMHGTHKFRWTEKHWNFEQLDPLRHQYDELGSLVMGILETLARSQGVQAHNRRRPDLFALLIQERASDPVLARFWHEINTVPAWVDWAQLARGQRFFYRYVATTIMGFALQGFIGQNATTASVAELLSRTGGFSTRALSRRLLERFQLLLQVTGFSKPVEVDLGPGGITAHETAIRVRLRHASVQSRILEIAEQREGYFDMGQHGIPINTLNSIHAIATFCCNHIWLQLPQQGVKPRQQEAEDYIALWRYVGYLLAVPTDAYFSGFEQAKTTMESTAGFRFSVPMSRSETKESGAADSTQEYD